MFQEKFFSSLHSSQHKISDVGNDLEPKSNDFLNSGMADLGYCQRVKSQPKRTAPIERLLLCCIFSSVTENSHAR